MESKRTNNFSPQEKSLFLSIAKNYKDIETKNFKKEGLDKKAKAWKALTKEFNASNTERKPVSEEALQGLWKRTKPVAKQASDKYRKECKKTGGGDPPKELTQDIKDAMEIMGDTYDPIDNMFDDDVELTQPDPATAQFDDGTVAETEAEIGAFGEKPEEIDNSNPSSSSASGTATPVGGKRKRCESEPQNFVPSLPPFLLQFAKTEHEAKMKAIKYQELAARLELHKLVEMCKMQNIDVPFDIRNEIEELDVPVASSV